MSEKNSEPEPITSLGSANVTAEVQPAKRRRPGQPCKLTPELSRKICDAIRMGCSLTVAARCVGVSLDSLQRWRTLGPQGKEPYASFLRDYEQAEAECKQTLLTIMYAAAPSDYRAARDVLRMRWPDEFGQRFDRFDGQGVTFIIEINLGPKALKPAAIPEVTADDAQAIELAAPSTKL